MDNQHRLPLFRTLFVGREAERARTEHLLAESPLVTITGAGGSGKTRLAVEIASVLRNRQAADVVFCDLGRVGAAGMAAHAVAETLGIPESAGTGIEDAIERGLQARPMLLLLDNCEHLGPDIGRLAEMILRSCPGVRILATSRVRLGVEGEVLLRLQPLSLPSTDEGVPAGDLRASEALQLFIARLDALSGDREWTAERLATAASICLKLEGLPLALELAAARAGALALEDLEQQLERCVDLARPGSSADGTRHQTLRAAIRWSHDLLDEREQVAFRRLAIFGGGATLRDIETVCSDAALPASELVDSLARLVEQSMVTVEEGTGSPALYRLLEPLRQFAMETLEAAGEAQIFAGRHAEHFLVFAEITARSLRGPGQAASMHSFDAENGNLRAALEWTLGKGHGVAIGAGLISAMDLYWLIRARFREALAWAALAMEHLEEGRALGEVLRTAGNAESGIGHHRAAIELLEHSVALERAHGDERTLGEALLWLGRAYERDRNAEGGRRAAAEAEPLLAPNDSWLHALRLRILAHCEKVATGDMACVLAIHEREHQLCIEAGDDFFASNVMNCLAEFARWDGDYPRAEMLYEECRVRRTDIGDQTGLAQTVLNRAMLAIERQENAALPELVAEGLERNQRTGSSVYSGSVFLGLAAVAARHNDVATGARFLGIAATAEGGRRSFDPPDQVVFDLIERELREAIGDAAFQVCFDGGALAGDAAGYREGHELLASIRSRLPATNGAVPRTTRRHPGGLSEREAEIVRMVASGLSNREIAETLVLSTRTVETHVANAYTKLGVNSRVEVTARAIQLGLATLPAEVRIT